MKVRYKLDMTKNKKNSPTKPRRNTPRFTSKLDKLKSLTQNQIILNTNPGFTNDNMTTPNLATVPSAYLQRKILVT